MGPQGRVVIPQHLRRSLGLEPGDELIAHVEGGRLVLERPKELLERLQHELRSARAERSLVDELITERRRESTAETGR